MTDTAPNEKNPLEMSDEEISNMSSFPQFMENTDPVEEEEDKEELVEEPEEESTDDTSIDDDQDDVKTEEEPDYEEAPSIYNRESTEEIEEEEDTSIETDEAEGYDSDGIDYKAEFEKLTSPFKAAGREVQINKVEDAISLMQMGVDYQNKMVALKPSLKIMKALENNGLLDEEKVNFLIDLDKKNPEAIAKFLKDKEIDPLEVDLDGANDYKAGSYAPSNQELDLDNVLDSIKDSPSFDRTIEELGSKWDSASRTKLMEIPSLVKTLNEHMDAGIYDQIMNMVRNERLFGRLQGLSDLAAYKAVGDALQAKGAFAHLAQETPPTRKHVQDPKLKDRKRAASPTKRTAVKKSRPTDFNPLSMTDEEFEKMTANKLY